MLQEPRILITDMFSYKLQHIVFLPDSLLSGRMSLRLDTLDTIDLYRALIPLNLPLTSPPLPAFTLLILFCIFVLRSYTL